MSPIIWNMQKEREMNEIYRMTVDLNVLDHLGINLYSNIAAVLTEAVANAWDADAERVDIEIDSDSKCIEITDDGVGMTVRDMNEKYLRVGYRRRDHDEPYGKVTAKGRPVMGRKGLGKLSLFSIANSIEIQSAKDGERHGLIMSSQGIQESVREDKPYYEPEPIPDENVLVEKRTTSALPLMVMPLRLLNGAISPLFNFYGSSVISNQIVRRFHL